jgi:hypothetical protein
MRTLLILCLLLLAYPTKENPIDPITEYHPRADFFVSYNKVRSYEGYYVNHPDDKGGETYAGVTRNYNKDWEGWKYIDKQELEWNKYVTGADSSVLEHFILDYYLTIWVDEGFYKMRNQRVADYLFDTRIHLSRRQTIKLMHRHGILIPGADPSWVNRSMESLNLEEFSKVRKNYYQKLIDKNPVQKVFFQHWSKRADNY